MDRHFTRLIVSYSASIPLKSRNDTKADILQYPRPLETSPQPFTTADDALPVVIDRDRGHNVFDMLNFLGFQTPWDIATSFHSC